MFLSIFRACKSTNFFLLIGRTSSIVLKYKFSSLRSRLVYLNIFSVKYYSSKFSYLWIFLYIFLYLGSHWYNPNVFRSTSYWLQNTRKWFENIWKLNKFLLKRYLSIRKNPKPLHPSTHRLAAGTRSKDQQHRSPTLIHTQNPYTRSDQVSL